MTTYAASQVRELLARGPQEDEDFYRLQTAGNGTTNWVNVTPEQLDGIAQILDADLPEPTNPGLHYAVLLLDIAEQPQTVHELAQILLGWVDAPWPL